MAGGWHGRGRYRGGRGGETCLWSSSSRQFRSIRRQLYGTVRRGNFYRHIKLAALDDLCVHRFGFKLPATKRQEFHVIDERPQMERSALPLFCEVDGTTPWVLLRDSNQIEIELQRPAVEAVKT